MRFILLLLLVSLAGCATRPAALEPRPVRTPVTAQPVTPVLSPADYLAISASRSLLLVRASELVEARLPVRAATAHAVAADHRGIAAQLNMAGRRLDLLPPARLLPDDEARLAVLSRSDELDLAYLGLVLEALSSCVRHERDYEARGTSPTLRMVARHAAGLCERSRLTFR